MKKKIAVIYHGDCPDGFGGAWAAWRKFGAKAEYIPARDRVNPPKGLAGREVYFIDWVYPLAIMLDLKRKTKKIIAIDHHESSRDATCSMDDFSYSSKHSGAVLSWEYFHTAPVPKLLKYVEDYDLWRFRLKETETVNAYITSLGFSFKEWSRMADDFENESSRKNYLAAGSAILKYRDKMVEEIAAKAELVEFFGHKVLAVNSSVFSDQLGHLLAKRKPPFGIIWRARPGQIRVSLRSIGNFDILRYAQKFGGGGHRESAGFTVPAGEPLPWKNAAR
jgi:uncharacterized protein